MKSSIKSVVALTVICAVISILLALTNSITAPLIEKNASAAANEALLIVMPDGEGFEAVDLTQYTLPATVTEAFKEANGGCVVKLTTAGYGSDFVIMCGVDKDGVVTGATCLSSTETLGYEKTYGAELAGKTIADVDSVDTIAGATKTTVAYKNAVKDAINTATILGGGSVDVRTDEEILNDNLSEALPAGEGKFTLLFVAENLDNVQAVYSADNGKGYVLVSGEEFIAVDETGVVLSNVSEDVKAVMEVNAKLVINSTLTEIDVTGYSDMPSSIEKAYKTETGNYVFDIKASGYGINGNEYVRSNEYIKIKVAVSTDGKVLSCQTVSQSESAGYGDVCAKPEYYSQYSGKTEATLSEVDAITGATITSDGYNQGVAKAFTALKIIKGEA